jgi:hypothetical protein
MSKKNKKGGGAPPQANNTIVSPGEKFKVSI